MKDAGTTGGLFRADGPRPIAPSESRLRSLIHNFLNRSLIVNAVTDARMIRTGSGPRWAVYPAEWPDITASIPITARPWAIEIKTETGELRESQKEMLPLLEAGGWLISCVRSVEEVSHELKIQLSLLDPKELDNYFVKIRQLHSEVARHAAELAQQKLERKLRKS